MPAIVLLSGGVDSATCLGMAVHEHGVNHTATASVFYGQKHRRELESARQIAAWYGVRHYVLDLAGVLRHSDCPLLAGSSREIPHKTYAAQMGDRETGMMDTYVPFRNGLMLSSAASLAMSLFPEDGATLYIGAHADDAVGSAYADCSRDFMHAMDQALRLGTYGKITLATPLVAMNKAQVVAAGLRLQVPYALTWSCYEGGERPCGECGTCRDRAAAFAANGVADPAQ